MLGHLTHELAIGVLDWANVSRASGQVSHRGCKRGHSWDSPELGVVRYWCSSSFSLQKAEEAC